MAKGGSDNICEGIGVDMTKDCGEDLSMKSTASSIARIEKVTAMSKATEGLGERLHTITTGLTLRVSPAAGIP